MAYNKKNKLLFYKKVQELTQQYFVPGVTTYSGIFRTYIEKEYPMTYNTYMIIINTNVDKELKELK